jgi:preprotein translocase subunit YajC
VIGSLIPLVAASSGSSGSTSQGFNPVSLIFIVLMVAVFYFLLIRPQQRRARSQRSLMDSLAVGDDVITIGGMQGTITEIDDDSVLLEVAPQIELRFIRSAIARKAPHMEEAVQADEEADEAR